MGAYGRFVVIAAVLVAGAAPVVAGAQTLPPPPYQTADQAGGAMAEQSPQMMDRYGGGSRRSYPVAGQPSVQAAPQRAPSGPYLAWAGKTEMQAAPATPVQAGGWSSMSRQWDAQPQGQAQVRGQVQGPAQFQTQAQMQVAQMAPPNNPWRPYRPQNAAPQPAPTSIYDAPGQAVAPPSQPYRQAQANPAPNPQGGPHFYSLHREYGIQPDPIPLPPQFFGPTADLSASVNEPLAKRTTTVNGQTKTVNVPDDQGAQ